MAISSFMLFKFFMDSCDFSGLSQKSGASISLSNSWIRCSLLARSK